MREKFYRFMQGRYGVDQLNRFLLVLMAISIIINTFFVRSKVTFFFTFLLMFISYFRMFSRNIYKRSSENTKYLQLKEKVTSFLRNIFAGNICRANFRQSNTYTFDEAKMYRIFKCPSCKQKLRVPKGKGKICISCKRCGSSFIKRT